MKSSRKPFLFLFVLCACLCLFLCSACASGVEEDEDGGVWDFNNNTYTDPYGNVHEITPEGVQEDDSGNNGGNGTVENPDGSITVITPDQDSNVQQNPDGSIEVGSGQIQGPEDSNDAPRAPLTGAEWQAVLNSNAARNGSETPTVWTDPATGTSCAVEVVYMGIGRSLVKLGGQKVFVNTVDLKWETTAPEDKVLAVISAPKGGYAWMRKQPNTKKTNPKLCQARTDAVVRVISTGKHWTLVHYDPENIRAYVQTGSLEFFANDHTDFEGGYMTYKGRTSGKVTVSVRSRDKGCRNLGDYNIGTPVTVFDILDNWVEVDACGFHARIKTEFVTLAKDLYTAGTD